MSVAAAAHIEPAELKALLEAVDPGVVLTPPRILRRIIKRDRKLPGIGLQVPHRKTYVIAREALFHIVDPAELGLEPEHHLPATVILINEPNPERLAGLSRGEALIKYWRLLLHSRVHVALEQRIKDGKLTQADLRQRIHRIGTTAFDEIRVVLEQERFLLPPRDDFAYYVEFVGLYLDLRHFAPTLSARYFPSLGDRCDIEEIIGADLDANALILSTRLPGAPDPGTLPSNGAHLVEQQQDQEPESALPGRASPASFQRFMAKADKASGRGNQVRAAILRRRAAAVAEPQLVPETMAAAQVELLRLADRLRAALGISEAEAEEWRKALAPLLEGAALPMWPVEARLLYDLQKVCTEHERETYALDLVGWIVSLGKLPLKRLLPNHRAVLMVNHLRRALRRSSKARISEHRRRLLAGLLHEAVEGSEERLRKRLRPLLTETLDRVQLKAQNIPERVARDKLTEELLDLVAERGYMTMGDLRDAISRNNLKLPDLANADEFFLGDRLIRTNRRLSIAWDGVYRRGEIYLRWLQRLSSLAFATRPGRFITRYLVLPYGVAYVALEGVLHLTHIVAHWTGGQRVRLTRNETMITVLVLGTFLFALMHSSGFRNRAWRALQGALRVLRAVFVDVPGYVLRIPLVRWVLESEGFAVLGRYVLKPLIFTGVTAVVYPLYGIGKQTALLSSAATFVIACVLLNTRVGFMLEESISDALVRTWLRFRVDVFPAIFAFTMSLFRGLVEAVERAIYTVDELLRFRAGQGRVTLVCKTILAFFWFFVTYIVRIYVNLFVEPTVNPIKHFPVVTVSAKLLVPFYVFLFHVFETPFLPLGITLARTMATLNVILLPGIFGFLVWELKENWRLYEANRSRTLRPVLIGHHGETMSRFLRPGFHSGTIPSLYAKLRRAERKAYRTGKESPAHKYREALHDIEERIRHFVEREFLALLRVSNDWEHLSVVVRKIAISSNRVGIDFSIANDPDEITSIAFEQRTRWLVASTTSTGCLGRLSEGQLAAWSAALAGLYKLANVDLIREQAEASFCPTKVSIDLLPEGLVVWPEARFDVEAVYALRDGEAVPPKIRGDGLSNQLPALDLPKLFFKNTPITWKRWLEVWEADRAKQGVPFPIVAGLVDIPLALQAPVQCSVK